jgi:hypothetical protein
VDIFRIEKLRLRLHEELASTPSVNSRVVSIFNYFNILLESNPEVTISYFEEFIPSYISLLNKFEPQYKDPFFTKRIIEQLNTINSLLNEKKELEYLIITLNSRLMLLMDYLHGKNDTYSATKVSFPVLEEHSRKDHSSGYLETITVEIKVSSTADQFILIPSGKEIEDSISLQVKTSWQLALNVAKKHFRRVHKYHKVIINFDNKLGYYSGSSLGTALTLSFIEELFSFYNTNVYIKTKGAISFTGGINDEGKILPLSEEVINRKVEVVFYSGIERFIVPEEEKAYAQNRYKQLQSCYPGRNLEIIGINGIEDLLNRRNIVAINKKSLVKRTRKVLRNQWIVLGLISINILLFYFSGLWDFDYNPAAFSNSGKIINVLNSNGKVLWRQETGFDLSSQSLYLLQTSNQRIIDIDEDGINEVLLCPELSNEDVEYGSVYCFDKNKNIIWSYKFTDTVTADAEYFAPSYRTRIIGEAELKGEKLIFLMALHNPYSTSAIYSISLKTGERRGGVLWHHGHYISGQIGDFNNDGTDEIVCTGINNCLERSVIFSIDIDKINGRAPSRKMWEYHNKPPAEFNKYVLLPKSDIPDYLQIRFNHPGILRLDESTNEFIFNTFEDNERLYSIHYNCDLMLENIRPTITDQYQVKRDSLVANGILNPPYTETKEYYNFLTSQIEYIQ